MIYNLSRRYTPNVSSYTVEPIADATYGFELNSNGYYESKNKGINSSYAICRVKLHLVANSIVFFKCINYAESNYDYGIMGKVDTALSLSNSADSTYEMNFKGKSQSSEQSCTYTSVEKGDHFIDIKYIKDSSQNSNNDTFQFKVDEIQEGGK